MVCQCPVCAQEAQQQKESLSQHCQITHWVSFRIQRCTLPSDTGLLFTISRGDKTVIYYICHYYISDETCVLRHGIPEVVHSYNGLLLLNVIYCATIN